MINRVKGWVLAATVLLARRSGAASLSDIQVSKTAIARPHYVQLMGDPEYALTNRQLRSVALVT